MALNTPQGQPSDAAVAPFQSASVPNTIGYRFTDLDPGANIYVQRDDVLVVQIMSGAPGDPFTVNARVLLPGRTPARTQPDAATADNPLGDSPFGVIVPITQVVKTTGAYTLTSQQIPLAEGYLLSLTVAGVNALTRGVAFARAFIVRGGIAVTNGTYLLCAGYLTNSSMVGWPNGIIESPLSGSGNIKFFTNTSFTAGQEFTFTPQLNARWRIASFQATLVTNAIVANRNVSLQLKDSNSGAVLGTYTANTAVPASTTALVTFAPGLQYSALIATDLSVPLPSPMVIVNNTNNSQKLVSLTQNLQAGDQWTLISFLIEEWLDY